MNQRTVDTKHCCHMWSTHLLDDSKAVAIFVAPLARPISPAPDTLWMAIPHGPPPPLQLVGQTFFSFFTDLVLFLLRPNCFVRVWLGRASKDFRLSFAMRSHQLITNIGLVEDTQKTRARERVRMWKTVVSQCFRTTHTQTHTRVMQWYDRQWQIGTHSNHASIYITRHNTFVGWMDIVRLCLFIKCQVANQIIQ